jgi:hypothetical protein
VRWARFFPCQAARSAAGHQKNAGGSRAVRWARFFLCQAARWAAGHQKNAGAAGPCAGRGSFFARRPDRPLDIKRTPGQPGRAPGEVLSLPGGQIGRRTSKERRGSRAVRRARFLPYQVARSAAGHQKNAGGSRAVSRTRFFPCQVARSAAGHQKNAGAGGPCAGRGSFLARRPDRPPKMHKERRAAAPDRPNWRFFMQKVACHAGKCIKNGRPGGDGPDPWLIISRQPA